MSSGDSKDTKDEKCPKESARGKGVTKVDPRDLVEHPVLKGFYAPKGSKVYFRLPVRTKEATAGPGTSQASGK